jgi:1-acyl-sn-glycerol-3-phosphate acyltransferase
MPSLTKLKMMLFPHRIRPKSDVLHSTLSYEWARWINLEYFWLFHGVRYRGQKNIPDHGPIIFAPNHVSYYDPTLVAAGIPTGMRFMAWDALFKFPVLKQILEGYGGYPVKLKSADKAAIEQTLRILKNRESIIIFPEGGRTHDGKLMPFEQGVARMALQTNAAIVPVTVTGIYDSWPRHRAFPKLCVPFTVKYHKPIYATPVERSGLKTRLISLNEEIAKPIARRLAAYERLKKYKATRVR